MKKLILRVISIMGIMCLCVFSFSVLAAESLKAANFLEIYPGPSPAEITDTPNGAKITFKAIDSRVTLCGTTEEEKWGRIVELNGLVIKMTNLNFKKPTNKMGVKTLAFTFSKEAGSFYATGSTGMHFRLFSTVDGCSAYAKKADAPDVGEDVYLQMTGIPKWDVLPANLTIKIYKTGKDYKFEFNEYVVTIPAASVEKNISRSGKVFVNIGIMGVNNYTADLVINEIYNDPALKNQGSSSSAATSSKATGSKASSSNAASSTATSSNNTVSSSVSTDVSSSEISAVSETEESKAPSGPAKLVGNDQIVKINNSKLTMSVKLGTTYEQLYKALTLTEGYDIAFYNADDRMILDESARVENNCFVKIVSGEKIYATFTSSVLTPEEFDAINTNTQTQPSGLPTYLIVIFIVLGVGVVGGGGFALYHFVLKNKLLKK